MPKNTSRNDFIERSVMGALAFLKESVYSDEYASKSGFLQSIDPRFKMLSFAVFLTAVIFTKSIVVCIAMYAVCLVLTFASKVQIGFFMKRTWIFIPVFALFIAMPAIFNIFTPGEPLVTLRFLGGVFVITRQGVSSAALFFVRVLVSVSFAILLSITTRHFELLKTLRIFKVPQVFVMTLGMCYRYIYLFIDVIEDTYLAIKSRVGGRIHYAKGQRIVAWNIAGLWQRSYNMNEMIYMAMLARGYTGEPVALHDFRPSSKDWMFLAITVAFCAVLLYAGNL